MILSHRKPRVVHLLICLSIYGVITAGSAMAQVRPPWYNPWVPGGAGDQSIVVPPQNSGLVGWRGLAANQVQDTDFANIVRMPVQMGIPAVWVFGQCFSGGMFDELNALGGMQSGISAATYDKTAFYPTAGGNTLDFVYAYLQAMRIHVRAESLAAFSAGNDPFGPNPAPITPRINEGMASEQPWYFSTGMPADNLQVARQPGGIAIIWSGQPEVVDRDQVIKLIDQLIAIYGYQSKQIFVLFGSGVLGPADPLVAKLQSYNPAIVLRAATKKQLSNLFTQAFGANQMNKPNFIFFLANDHGYNTAIAAGAPVPRQGDGGGPVAEDPYPNGYGGGDGDTPIFPSSPPPSPSPSPTPMSTSKP